MLEAPDKTLVQSYFKVTPKWGTLVFKFFYTRIVNKVSFYELGYNEHYVITNNFLPA